MERCELDQSVIDAFYLMWGNFPEVATLVHKSKKVIAANKASKEFGREVGMVCSKHGPPESHQGCLANKALADQEAKIMIRKLPDKRLTVYWLPIDGYPDYYVHLVAGTLGDQPT